MSAMYGQKAKSLLQELQRSDWLPPYNDEGVRQVVAEVNALHEDLRVSLKSEGFSVLDVSVASGMLVNYESIARDKRCMLAYL